MGRLFLQKILKIFKKVLDKSYQKDYAYTCLDVSGNPSGIEEKLKAVENVVGFRVIK